MANLHTDLFSSLISDIKSYSGNDPLLPWLRGIRKMKELPPQLLRQKLPRFLQKCAQTFQTDRRYTNDLRYIRIWLQLMDFLDDPKAALRTMEANRIGMKKSLFYQAYALYYEKMKKFEAAEKMYHLGVQNLAEPVAELQKSYEQFLHRMERQKNKKIRHQLWGKSNRLNHDDNVTEMPMKECDPSGVALDLGNVEVSEDPSTKKGVTEDFGHKGFFKQPDSVEAESDEPRNIHSDKTEGVKFVNTAVVRKSGSEDARHHGLSEPTINTKEAMNAIKGMFREPAMAGKSDAEDARHHGLVEPTINTKEAMNAINGMFREPLEPALVRRRSHKSQPKPDQSLKNGFEVFIDDNLGNDAESSNQVVNNGLLQPQFKQSETHQPLQEPLQIYIEDEESNQIKGRIQEREQNKFQILTEGATVSTEHVKAFVFPSPNDIPSECPKDLDVERLPQARFREDTVVYRFVGSTISDEPEVENVCHHGLVEPTINLKEAMEDINNMFGKPIEFARKTRPKKQDKALDRKKDCGQFLILPDDDSSYQQGKFKASSSAKNESDLFEPTVCTKEAMDEINKMFGMPLDF